MLLPPIQNEYCVSKIPESTKSLVYQNDKARMTIDQPEQSTSIPPTQSDIYMHFNLSSKIALGTTSGINFLHLVLHHPELPYGGPAPVQLLFLLFFFSGVTDTHPCVLSCSRRIPP